MGNLDMVRYLVEIGASTTVADGDCNNALFMSALHGHFSTMQYVLEHTDADLEFDSGFGEPVWDILFCRILSRANHMCRKEVRELIALLRVLVLRGDGPPEIYLKLPEELELPEFASILEKGARLRAQLPAYLVRRRALLDKHCPKLLPPLRALVHDYMKLTTTDELWATGLVADTLTNVNSDACPYSYRRADSFEACSDAKDSFSSDTSDTNFSESKPASLDFIEMDRDDATRQAECLLQQETGERRQETGRMEEERRTPRSDVGCPHCSLFVLVVVVLVVVLVVSLAILLLPGTTP
jgi:hypothetical protein